MRGESSLNSTMAFIQHKNGDQTSFNIGVINGSNIVEPTNVVQQCNNVTTFTRRVRNMD